VEPSESPKNVRSVAERLQAATTELQGLEQIILSGDFSPRILSEFRNAVDNIRQTARAVQTWIGLQQQNRDPYSVMTALSADRVRRATQIAKELTIDLQAMEIDFETEGLRELFQAVEELRERLMPIFGPKP
jgi:phosphoribosylpyrophosphate synthetase